MNRFDVLACCFALCGCGATTALIKAPVAQQCAGYGLKGCPELVDGVLLYVDGDKEGATNKLKRAVAQNAPADMAKFAQALEAVLPGDASQEIVALLSAEPSPARAPDTVPVLAAAAAAKLSIAASEEAEGNDLGPMQPSAQAKPEIGEALVMARGSHVQLALAAPVDPSRMVTESVSPQREEVRFICDVAGKAGVCVARQAGPLVVTDARVPSGCSVDLYVGAADANHKLAWVIQANAPGVQGGNFFVRADQWLTVAARGVGTNIEGDARCLVTWAGYRPRMVPASL